MQTGYDVRAKVVEGSNMIKIRFCSDDSTDDACELLENNLTNHMDITDWLIEKIPSLGFDCMDFPYDMEDCFDCYFTSSFEESDAIAVYRLLKDSAKDSAVKFSVDIVDDKMNFVKEITER